MAIILQTFSPADCHVRACVVNDRGMADLLVYRVSSRGLAAGSGVWYITQQPTMSPTRIFFGTFATAKLLVFFVNSRGEAGWQREHPLKGRL